MTAATDCKGERAVRFINNLQHTKGKHAGQGFNLRGWQQDIIRPLFGTLMEDGRRVYRTCFTFLPRKNGKSELAAAIALYMLLGDGEMGGEIYSAAADRDQAALVFNVAADMVRHDPVLSKHCKIIDSQKRIVNHRTGSFYRAISSEAHSKHGFNPSCIVADEIHAWRGRQLWDVLRTGVGAREQPLTFAITTAGYDRDGLEFELFNYAKGVRDGVIDDPTFLPVLYYAEDDDDWKDEATWHKANPALGDFRSLEEMQNKCREAQNLVSRQNAFRRLYLNQHTEQETRWLDMDAWEECGGDDVDLSGCQCWGGLDLAATIDMTAFALVFRKDGNYHLRSWFWVPEDADKKRERLNKVRYKEWIRAGYVFETQGAQCDYDQMRGDIVNICEKYNVQKIAIDRGFNGSQVAADMQDKDGLPVILFPMSIQAMSPPTKRLEGLVSGRQLLHDSHPAMRWMASNVVARSDANDNLRPDKSKSGDKIDGIVAAIMALAMESQAAEDNTSIYSSRGMITI